MVTESEQLDARLESVEVPEVVKMERLERFVDPPEVVSYDALSASDVPVSKPSLQVMVMGVELVCDEWRVAVSSFSNPGP